MLKPQTLLLLYYFALLILLRGFEGDAEARLVESEGKCAEAIEAVEAMGRAKVSGPCTIDPAP